MKPKFELFSILIAIMAFGAIAQSENFSINIVVNYLDFSIEHADGGDYTSWWITEIIIGDTAMTDHEEIVKITNLSNVPIDIYCDARDFPDSATADSLWEPWAIDETASSDRFALRWASYTSAPTTPNIEDSSPVLEVPMRLDSEVASGAVRFLCGWFLAPTDGFEDEQHRILTRWTIAPFAGD
ncbi:MAG TPA: hypothetical protein ENN07_00100 [candidate division Zixibacteria bacterium]|nr:hypothetical protein [candidate division Zixibacteria bacterium]